ncbi:MAG: glycosyltransferase [Sandaracinaceae bacterium]
MKTAGPRTRRRKRVLAISSGGGHWIELLRLRPAFDGHFVAFATVSEAYRPHVPGAPLYVVPDATRWDRWGLVKTTAAVARVLAEVRPDVVVSTGALPGFLALVLAKRLGMKTIWVDSLANVEEMSMSGQKVAPFADLWLTQWEELAYPGGPRFAGSVIG